MSCIEWEGARDAYGYGMRRWAGKVVRTHRLAFALEHGYWPEVVMHKCDNPPCYNPDHLAVGTRDSNNADRDAKGRHAGNKQTHCLRGHPHIPGQKCKPCAAIRARAYYAEGRYR